MSTYWKVISLDPGGFRSSFSAEEILQNSNIVLISALLNYVRPSCFLQFYWGPSSFTNEINFGGLAIRPIILQHMVLACYNVDACMVRCQAQTSYLQGGVAFQPSWHCTVHTLHNAMGLSLYLVCISRTLSRFSKHVRTYALDKLTWWNRCRGKIFMWIQLQMWLHK